MGRFCYRSKILPGKKERVRQHWREKKEETAGEEQFWQALTMTGFASYLQSTPAGDFMLHCLDGESLPAIFRGLREEIQKKNPIALNLQKFYLEVLGKDYALEENEPRIECLADLSSENTPEDSVRRVFFLPLLPEKVQEHIAFRKDPHMIHRKNRDALMQAFGTYRHIVWLQHDASGSFVVIDSERKKTSATCAEERLALGKKAPTEWQEQAALLMEHTGLSYNELSPDVELLCPITS